MENRKIDPLWALLLPNSLSNEELKQSLQKVNKMINKFVYNFLLFLQFSDGTKCK